jgi:uncharacterized membrane protein
MSRLGPSRRYLAAGVFAVASLVFGLITIAVTPPLFGIDESTHFVRIIELGLEKPDQTNFQKKLGPHAPIQLVDISHLPLLGVKDLSKIQDELAKPTYNLPVEWDAKKRNHVGSSASTYGWPSYTQYRLAAALGERLDLTAINLVNLMRLSGLLLYIAIVCLALILSRHATWGLAFFAASPGVVYLAATINADGLAIALAFLLTGILSNLYARGKLHPGLLALALGVVAWCSVIKVVYGLLGLLLLAIPLAYFGSKKWYAAWALVVGIMSVVPGLLWTQTVRASMVEITKIYRKSQGNINYEQQLSYVTDQPLAFVLALVRTVLSKSQELFNGIHSILGWSYVNLPFVVTLLIFIGWLLSPAAFRDHSVKPVPRLYGVVYVLVAGLVTTAIAAALYLSFTPVGHHVVYGVQGRYLIPLVPPLMLAFTLPSFITIERRAWLWYLGVVLVLGYLAATVALYATFHYGHRLF